MFPNCRRIILRKLKKNYEITLKKSKVEKNFRKSYIKFGESLKKTCEISKLILRTFERINFRNIKSRPSRNHRDEFFEKNFRKT